MNRQIQIAVFLPQVVEGITSVLKKGFLLLFLFVSVIAHGQTDATYSPFYLRDVAFEEALNNQSASMKSSYNFFEADKMVNSSYVYDRLMAVKSLKFANSTKSIQLLTQLMESDNSTQVRAQAAEALGIYRNRVAVPALIAALSDKEEAVRVRACMALSRCGEKVKSFDFLQQLLEQNNPPYDAIVYVCTQTGDSRVIPVLQNILQHQNDLVAVNAAIAIAALGEGAKCQTLLLNALNNPSTRLAAMRGLAYIGNKASLNAITNLANDEDLNVANRARSILSFYNISMPFINLPLKVMSYNPSAAASYANTWTCDLSWGVSCSTYTGNPAYNYYTGNDCSNFTSQCMIAGSLSLWNGPGTDPWGCIPFCDNLHLNLVNSQGASYQVMYSGYPSAAQFTQGDIVMFGDAAADDWQHAAINVSTGTPALNAHTNNRYQRPVNYFYPSASFPSAYFYHITGSAVVPSNDNCANAIMLNSNITCINTAGTVNGATNDGFPAQPTCDQTSTFLSGVFYTFSATQNSHTITVDPTGASVLDAVIVVYQGSSCFALNEVACMDTPGGNGVTTVLTFPTTPGVQYWIRVYDWGATAPANGDFDICITHSCTPPAAPSFVTGPSSVCFSQSQNFTVAQVAGATSYNWTGINGNGANLPQTTSNTSTSILWNNTGASIDIVCVTASNACGTSSTTCSGSINLLSAPVSPVISGGGTSICQGQNATLTISNPCSGCTYQWSNGQSGTSVNVSNTGSYSATATNACGSATSSSVSITVNPAPTTPVISGGNSSICQGQSVTLTVSNPCSGCTYQWSNGQSGTSITVSSSGTYSVAVSNSCGTANSQSVTVTVNPLPTTPTLSQSGNISLCPGATLTASVSNCIGCTINWSTGQSGNQINVNASGNYYATATNTCGTSSPSQTANVTLITPPSVTVTPSGPVTFCQPGSVTLTANTTNCASCNYQWSNGATSTAITVNSTANYIVTVTNSCNATAIASLNVTANPAPAQPSIILNGNTSMITNTQSLNYQWYYNGSIVNGATSTSLLCIGSGNYYVVATDNNSCTATSNSLPVACTVGISEIGQDYVSFYPNPVNAGSLLTIEGIKNLKEVLLYSMEGKTIIAQPGINGLYKIPMVSAGAYILSIKTSEGAVLNKKLFIK